MKLIHAGDIHLDPRAPAPALASLSRLLEYCGEHHPAALLLAGDLFDRAVPATTQAGMTDLIRLMREFASVTQVIASTGTPTHDRPGCYEPLMPDITLLDNMMWWGGSHDLVVTATPEPRIRVEDDGEEAAALDRTRAMLRAAAQHADTARQHGHKVHVHMHHGAIAAATTETGWYTTGAPGELSLLPQDLDIPQADYVALGHIHRQQPVEGCHTMAWYCGSAYPTDWGEREQKAALLVEIPDDGGADVRVRPLPYPHRPRRKHSITVPAGVPLLEALGSAPELQTASAPSCDIWLQVTHDPQVQPTDEDRAIIADLLERAAIPVLKEQETDVHPHHRLELRPAPRETVVRADLSDVPGWDEQLALWLDATEGPIPTDAQRELALELQRRTAGPSGGQPRAWRIDRLVLRGARGLSNGNLDLDLRKFPPGLLAISGPNGAGKTTILEHMCPWPELLTRGGSLNAAFSGANARRELTMTETESGKKLTMFISVSGSGKRHHAIYLHGADPGGPNMPFQKQTDVLDDGTTNAYVTEIERMFGERSTYVAGGIQPQRPIMLNLRGPDGTASRCTSDLIQAPAGMRRHLLRAILGLDAYQHGAGLARNMARDFQVEAAGFDTLVKGLPEPDTEIHDLHAEAERKVHDADENLSVARTEMNQLREQQPAVKRAADECRKHREDISAARWDVKSAKREYFAATQRAQTEDALAERLPALEAKHQEIERLREDLDEARAAADKDRLERVTAKDMMEAVREARRKAADARHDRDLAAWRSERDAIESERTARHDAAARDRDVALKRWHEATNAYREILQEIARRDAEIQQAKADTVLTMAETKRLDRPGEPCSVCGQPLGEDKRAELLAAAAKAHQDAGDLLAEASQERDRLKDAAPPDPGPMPTTPPVDTSDLDAAAERLVEPQRPEIDSADLDARREAIGAATPNERRERALNDAFRELRDEWNTLCDSDPEAMTKARLAAARAASAKDEAERAYARVTAARQREAEAQALFDEDALNREADLTDAIESTYNLLAERRHIHSDAVATLRIAEHRLGREQKAAAYRRKLDESRAAAARKGADARLLADALAPTGIQALLLEAAAPQIAADANAALADSYGERWQIRLELQKVGRDKIAEDLRIIVTDTASRAQPSDDQLGPGEQLAETLSGGEATWVRAALAGALALARARHTGQRQLTALLDEADGALSEDARVKYFDLLESQHRALGRHHTVVVTHSQEMLDRLGPERVIRLG